MSAPALRPGDIAIALQLLLTPEAPYADLARRVHLSVGETHNAVKRLTRAKLIGRHDRHVIQSALYDLLVSGVPYVFAAELGPETRGVPTAHAVEPLASRIIAEDVVVWPSASGSARGASIIPLYPGATATAVDNPELYRLLAATDALRIGRARERQLAREFLRQEVLERAAS